MTKMVIYDVLERINQQMRFGVDTYSKEVFKSFNVNQESQYLINSKELDNLVDLYLLDSGVSSYQMFDLMPGGQRVYKEAGLDDFLANRVVKRKLNEYVSERSVSYIKEPIIPKPVLWYWLREQVIDAEQHVREMIYFQKMKDIPTEELEKELAYRKAFTSFLKGVAE